MHTENIFEIPYRSKFDVRPKSQITTDYLVLSPLLTANTALIHTFFTYPKLNMDVICGLKFYLLYVHTSQNFLLKSLHAQRRSFLVLNLYF